jgi:hypothetical protein
MHKKREHNAALKKRTPNSEFLGPKKWAPLLKNTVYEFLEHFWHPEL